MRLWWGLEESALGGSLGSNSQVLCWWQKSGFSRHEDVFTFILPYKQIYKFVLSMGFAKIIL
jgi:hypothetical protein